MLNNYYWGESRFEVPSKANHFRMFLLEWDPLTRSPLKGESLQVVPLHEYAFVLVGPPPEEKSV